MKTTKLFRTAMQTALTLLLFVSCTTNEESTNETQDLNKANKNGSTFFMPTPAKGKLIFENNTPFQMEARLTAIGGLDHVTPDAKFEGMTILRRSTITIFDDFKIVNQPIAEILNWHSDFYGDYSGADANDSFALYLNDVDNQDGIYVKWDNFKMGEFKGPINSVIPNNDGTYTSEFVRINGLSIGLPQNEGDAPFLQLPPTQPVFSSGFPQNQYLHFTCTANVLPNGDTQVIFNSFVDTNP